ncbi:MAG TPA: AraC family transcriptional regulator [Acidimicrobiales bacterium]
MTAMVRAQALRGYPELVRDLGGSSSRLLRKAGVDPAAINQLTSFISFETLIDLLERSADDLGCADFGLRLAERQDIGILGTLAMAMRHSATVGEAMGCVSTYLGVHNAALAFTIGPEEHRDRAALAFQVLDAHAPQWAQTAEHGVGLTWRIMTLLSDGRCRLSEVWFPHRQVGSTESYRDRFDAPVTFRADHPALFIAARDLDLAISEHNQVLHDAATDYLASKLGPRSASFTSQVRHAIEALLGTGTCSYRQVASALHISPRTLQRRLADEGTSFEILKDETRRDLAQRYLSQPDVPLTQVSALLDYSEQSALGRSCRRWFNAPPRSVRAHLISSVAV